MQPTPLARLMEQKQITPLRLESALDSAGHPISRPTINAYMNGTRNPSGYKLAAIADALGCSTDYLLGRTE